MSPVPFKQTRPTKRLLALAMLSAVTLSSCADVKAPGVRDVNIPVPRGAETRREGVNERPDSVIYLPLGEDVLIPEAGSGSPLPATIVGPFELRSETLAGALQLILDGVDIPIAFETTSGLDTTITVTDLKGPLDRVVAQVCSLANLYCSYENGVLVVKETEVFTVAIPPIVPNAEVATLMTNIATAIGSIVGGTAPITDPSTRTIVYRATQRTAEVAQRYFQRLKNNTALVVFETYIWEVTLNNGNTTGIRWDMFEQLGQFNVGINLPGAANPLLGTPISIGLPTRGDGPINYTTADVFQFISSYGAVKTISQPQLTVLSGSSARLRIADTQNYVASISRTTTDGGNTTVSTSTDSVDSGFTLEIASNWDNATVYSNLNILLQEVRDIETFDDNPDAVVQLPQTTERELQTQVRIRPGDSLLIAGLVRESDNFDKTGPGVSEPLIPISRSARVANSELVFLLRPRVIVFTTDGAAGRPGAEAAARAIPMKAPEVQVQPLSAQSDPVPVPMAPPPVAPAPGPVTLTPIPLVDPVPAKPVVMHQPVPVEMAPLPAPVAQPAPPAPAAPQAPKKAASATADPSVIIDYNVLQGR